MTIVVIGIINYSDMSKNHRERITLELDPELKKKLEARARREDLDLSKLVRRALREFLQPRASRPSPA